MSAARLKGFSDGLIAIIVTLMILELPLPQTMGRGELLTFLKALVVYGASFIIVGGQWNRHHLLLEDVGEVSNVFLWENLIYLFLLSLVPLFMKWVAKGVRSTGYWQSNSFSQVTMPLESAYFSSGCILFIICL